MKLKYKILNFVNNLLNQAVKNIKKIIIKEYNYKNKLLKN